MAARRKAKTQRKDARLFKERAQPLIARTPAEIDEMIRQFVEQSRKNNATAKFQHMQRMAEVVLRNDTPEEAKALARIVICDSQFLAKQLGLAFMTKDELVNDALVLGEKFANMVASAKVAHDVTVLRNLIQGRNRVNAARAIPTELRNAVLALEQQLLANPRLSAAGRTLHIVNKLKPDWPQVTERMIRTIREAKPIGAQ